MSKTLFLPTRDLVIFPGIVTPIYVGRAKSVSTLESAVNSKSKLVLGMQKDPSKEDPELPNDIYKIGVIVNILQIVKMPNNNIKVLIEAEDRVMIEDVETTDTEYTATYKTIKCTNGKAKETEAIYRKVLGYFEKFVGLTGKISPELLVNLKGIKDINSAFDIISSNLPVKSEVRQELLEIFDVKDRGFKLLELLASEMEIASLEKKIDDKVKTKMNEAQKSYYIKEKINAMKEELGDFSRDEDMLDLVEKLNKTKLPKNPILLTFDDGYQDNYLEALPLLKKYNMTAVVFPIYNWIGKPNKWENFGKQETTTMNLTELKSWLNHGLDIQPHTADHPFLTQCNEEKLNLEIIDTKTKFEKLLDKPMDYLCYPYGFFNQQVINIVKKANYKMAFAIFENVPLWHINLFALPRIPIPSHQKMWEFKFKISSIHIIFVAMRKWERQFKQLKNKFS